MLELAGEDKAALDKIAERFSLADQGDHRHYRDSWTELDKLYHGYKALKDSVRGTQPKDRYPYYNDARREFGHELHIPYAFSIVETVLPRLLSNRPRMLVLPKDQASERNVENMRALIDDQQGKIDYELRAQEIAKSGLMYGLGVGKTYWRRKEVEKTTTAPASWILRAAGIKHKLVQQKEMMCDDPMAEAVNVRDFFWDPFATSIDDARWVIHRTWRDTGYVMERIESGAWDYAPGPSLEDVESVNGAANYYTAHSGPREAQGVPNPSARDTDVHEVWEYHDRYSIVTVLDRKWIVGSTINEAYPGRLCFQCYRPTHIINQFVGYGEIEPIRDLQYEMDMLRTHRRWNAEMAMHKAFFYTDGLVDPHKVRIGPGEMNPVNGDPREVLFPIEIGDVPYSSYREAQEIASDIERASGISDSVAGADAGAAQTATGIQLVQAAANARIQLKTRRVELEIIRAQCRHWGALNQRYILGEREIEVPAEPTPEEPDRMSVWLRMGPAELAGNFDFEPEGGSTTPENIPQKRQDAQIKMGMLNIPGVNVREMLLSIMEDMGFKRPPNMLAPEVYVPPQTLDYIAQQLIQAGVDQQMAQQIVGGALNQALDEQQAGQGGPAPPEAPPVG